MTQSEYNKFLNSLIENNCVLEDRLDLNKIKAKWSHIENFIDGIEELSDKGILFENQTEVNNILAGTHVYTVDIPDNIIKIGRGFAFWAPDLVQVNFNPTSKCKEIGISAFAQCPELERIFLPDSITEIAFDAFIGSDYVTIYTNNEYIKEYAKEHNIPCKPWEADD